LSEIVNLLTDLDRDDVSEEVSARMRRAVEAAGFRVRIERGADDRTLAWIDDVFGGAWSSEAFAGRNVIAERDGAPVAFASFAPEGLRYGWLRGVAREPGVGIFGPLGVDAAYRKTRAGDVTLGAAVLKLALCAMRAMRFARALIPAVGPLQLVAYYERQCGARVIERFDSRVLMPQGVRTVVMASGNGSNFQRVLDCVASGTLPLDVRALVTNNAGAYAIERAKAAAIPSIHVLPWRRKELARDEYDARLLQAVASEEPELVLLLGWMHVLGGAFLASFPEMLNVHPAFLPLDPRRDDVGMPDGTIVPAFRGARAVRDALAAGSPWVGASVHRVTAETDRGPVLVRKPMRVRSGDDENAVLERLHPIEHQLVETGIRRWLYEQ
jgi:phosphoribosylglycinamide formyltransferase-1